MSKLSISIIFQKLDQLDGIQRKSNHHILLYSGLLSSDAKPRTCELSGWNLYNSSCCRKVWIFWPQKSHNLISSSRRCKFWYIHQVCEWDRNTLCIFSELCFSCLMHDYTNSRQSKKYFCFYKYTVVSIIHATRHFPKCHGKDASMPLVLCSPVTIVILGDLICSETKSDVQNCSCAMSGIWVVNWIKGSTYYRDIFHASRWR